VNNFDSNNQFHFCMETSHLQWSVDFSWFNSEICIFPTWRRNLKFLRNVLLFVFVFIRWWSFYFLSFSTLWTIAEIPLLLIVCKVVCYNYSLLLLVFHYKQFVKRTRPRAAGSRKASKFSSEDSFAQIKIQVRHLLIPLHSCVLSLYPPGTFELLILQTISSFSFL